VTVRPSQPVRSDPPAGSPVRRVAAVSALLGAAAIAWLFAAGAVPDLLPAEVAPAPPLEARDDRYDLVEDVAVRLDVLANDRPGDGPVELLLIADGTRGRLQRTADGRVRYEPPRDFAGVDGFSYRLLGPDGASAEARVELAVAAVRDPPALVEPVVELRVPDDLGALLDLEARIVDVDGDVDGIVAVRAPGRDPQPRLGDDPGEDLARRLGPLTDAERRRARGYVTLPLAPWLRQHRGAGRTGSFEQRLVLDVRETDGRVHALSLTLRVLVPRVRDVELRCPSPGQSLPRDLAFDLWAGERLLARTRAPAGDGPVRFGGFEPERTFLELLDLDRIGARWSGSAPQERLGCALALLLEDAGPLPWAEVEFDLSDPDGHEELRLSAELWLAATDLEQSLETYRTVLERAAGP
jgi:hypothetical protein